jgi:hypothetical protein
MRLQNFAPLVCNKLTQHRKKSGNKVATSEISNWQKNVSPQQRLGKKGFQLGKTMQT